MELAKDTNILKTNAKFERQQFGVGDMSIVMNLLSKLYSNPIQTLTQEYISNARDANRESKTKIPIEITVPTRFSPVIKIRDYGIGLTPERISSVFLLYGNSTKRTNNKQTGGFGIGAKSAWAYTDSFTIVTYVDGTKRTYIAHKSSGNGNLDLIEEIATDEPNGTCIEIAVKQHDTSKFREAVLRTIFFWDKKEKPVIHGITDEIKEHKPKFKFDNVKLYSDLPEFIAGYRNEHLVVIDGIPYKIPSEITYEKTFVNATQKIKNNITCFINTGDIEISPSREEIVINDNTKEFLNTNVFTPLEINVEQFVSKEYSKATTMKKTIEMYSKLNNNFNVSAEFQDDKYSLGWQGNILNHKDWRKGDIIHIKETSDNRIQKEKRTTLHIDQINKAYYIDTKESPLASNKRFRTLLNNGDTDIIYIKNVVDSAMIKNLGLVKLSTITPTEKPKNTVKSTRIAISKREIILHKPIHVKVNWNYREWRAKPISKIIGEINEQIVYMPLSHRMAKIETRKAYTNFYEYVNNVYFIADGRIKLIENNKHFIHVDKFIKEYKLSKEEKIQLMANEIQDRSNINFLKAYVNDLKDTKLVKILRIALQYENKKGIAPKLLTGDYLKSNIFTSFKKLTKEVESTLHIKYPLVFGNAKITEQVAYLNYINSKGDK